MKLGPHLHRIGNDIVAAYLVDTEDGVTVIDAGLAGHWPELTAELTSMGRSVGDIRGVVLTHGDTDHLGFAERLRRDHGVPVYVHEADAARARGEEKTKPSWGPVKAGAIAGFLWYAMRKGGLRTTYLTEVVGVRDGQVLDLPGTPRVIGLPGHSPGSIAIHIPVADAVFVGDGLTTRHVLTGRRGPQPAPFTDDPEQALRSLSRLEGIEAAWLLPGHGTPWNGGIAEAVRAIRAVAADPQRG
jgi:glyoxylase-like metal-dependent hydrolase (beta-lactamase superfamily II)